MADPQTPKVIEENTQATEENTKNSFQLLSELLESTNKRITPDSPKKSRWSSSEDKQNTFQGLIQEAKKKIESGEVHDNTAVENYSELNQWLILLQNPNVIEVRSFNQWKKKGYSIKAGEKGIMISEPHKYEKKTKIRGKTVSEEKTGFHISYIFDFDQVHIIEKPSNKQYEKRV